MGVHSTRSVQKIIELSCNEEILIIEIIEAIKANVLELSLDNNGCHVIQSCLNNFVMNYNEIILKTILDSCLKIACNRQGCCVIQKCIETEKSYKLNSILNEILNNCKLLIQVNQNVSPILNPPLK
jgi:hypothetical protein